MFDHNFLFFMSNFQIFQLHEHHLQITRVHDCIGMYVTQMETLKTVGIAKWYIWQRNFTQFHEFSNFWKNANAHM